MTASAYTPSAEFPTYADYRKSQQRKHRAAWKKRNAEAYLASELKRRRERYATEPEYKAWVAAHKKKAYLANPDVAKARSKAHRVENKASYAEYDKQYYKVNKPTIQAYKSKWAKANAALVNSRNAARRALCLKATPSWADKSDISDVYQEARHMQMHVDHIIPLNHPLVCGLHVWDNLQLLPPVDNMRKNNRFDPETFNAS